MVEKTTAEMIAESMRELDSSKRMNIAAKNANEAMENIKNANEEDDK